MKNLILALMGLLVILNFNGCAQTEPIAEPITETTPAEFDAASFTTHNAEDVSVDEADFNGDGVNEKILYYKSENVVWQDQTVDSEHLLVIALEDNKWQVVKEDAFPNSNSEVLRFLRDYKVVDADNDGNKELFVQDSLERPMPAIGTYYLIAHHDSEYKFVHPPAMNNLEYLDIEAGETEIHLKSIDITDTGLEEQYAIYCEEDMEGKPMASRYSEICRDLKIEVKYTDGQLTRKGED
ncbi:hypothetical protein ACFL3C_01930 [Patescibacteria group bacterium]